MIKRRVLSSTSASSLPPDLWLLPIVLDPRVGAQQPVSCSAIATLLDGAAIWLLVILLGLAGILYAVIGGLRTGSGGLHQRYWAGYRRVDGAGIRLIAMGKGSLYAGH